MNISRVKGHPPKTPHDSSASKEPSTKKKHFPKPTGATFREKGKAWESQAPNVSRRITPKPMTIESSPKTLSLKRVTRSQSNKFSSGPEPSSTKIKDLIQIHKKRVRDPNEIVSKSNHEDLVLVSKKIKKIGKPILGSPSNSGPRSCGKKENTKVGKKKKEKKIFPQSTVINEIHSESKNVDEITISHN